MGKMETNQHKEIIRASEIGTYMFCNRAWWLKRQEGRASTNLIEMSRGTRRHAQHARTVQGASALQRVSYTLIALSLIFIILYFALQ